jgi:hypothetical protein
MLAQYVCVPSWLVYRAQIVSKTVHGADFMAKFHQCNRLATFGAWVDAMNRRKVFELRLRKL